MQAHLRDALASALGSQPASFEGVSGGCISDAYACTLADGRQIFVKTKAGCDPAMFHAEAKGLQWLASANCLRIPEVLAVGDDYLALQFLAAAPEAEDYDAQLGRGLALLHQSGADSLGFSQDGFLATLPQDNRASASWADFYVERRLEPLIQMAVDQAKAPTKWAALFTPILEGMAELLGDEQAIARLHGDLWTGNVHTDESGSPVLIDPAAYGGNREIDLAMLKLFGNPSDAFYRAYQGVWPLEHDHQARVALYQLYPLLAHVNLFGGSYVAACERVAKQYR